MVMLRSWLRDGRAQGDVFQGKKIKKEKKKKKEKKRQPRKINRNFANCFKVEICHAVKSFAN